MSMCGSMKVLADKVHQPYPERKGFQLFQAWGPESYRDLTWQISVILFTPPKEDNILNLLIIHTQEARVAALESRTHYYSLPPVLPDGGILNP